MIDHHKHLHRLVESRADDMHRDHLTHFQKLSGIRPTLPSREEAIGTLIEADEAEEVEETENERQEALGVPNLEKWKSKSYGGGRVYRLHLHGKTVDVTETGGTFKLYIDGKRHADKGEYRKASDVMRTVEKAVMRSEGTEDSGEGDSVVEPVDEAKSKLKGWRKTGVCPKCGKRTITGGECKQCGWRPAKGEAVERMAALFSFDEDDLDERQKVQPTLGGETVPGSTKIHPGKKNDFGGRGPKTVTSKAVMTRQGSFKLSSKALKLFATGGITPDKTLFKSQQKIMSTIDRTKLPRVIGAADMPGAQDELARNPKGAIQKFMRNIHKVSPKVGKMLRAVPENAALYFYIYAMHVSGRDMADEILKRYLTTHQAFKPGKREDVNERMAAIFSFDEDEQPVKGEEPVEEMGSGEPVEEGSSFELTLKKMLPSYKEMAKKIPGILKKGGKSSQTISAALWGAKNARGSIYKTDALLNWMKMMGILGQMSGEWYMKPKHEGALAEGIELVKQGESPLIDRDESLPMTEDTMRYRILAGMDPLPRRLEGTALKVDAVADEPLPITEDTMRYRILAGIGPLSQRR